MPLHPSPSSPSIADLTPSSTTITPLHTHFPSPKTPSLSPLEHHTSHKRGQSLRPPLQDLQNCSLLHPSRWRHLSPAQALVQSPGITADKTHMPRQIGRTRVHLRLLLLFSSRLKPDTIDPISTIITISTLIPSIGVHTNTSTGATLCFVLHADCPSHQVSRLHSW